jgi:hypothetical protein
MILRRLFAAAFVALALAAQVGPALATALSITASGVVYVNGPRQSDAQAGEAFVAGAAVYRKATDGKWWKAQADGTADEAGLTQIGMALGTADAAGARVSVALQGAIVTIGAGVSGTVYYVGPTAGAVNPIADVATTGWYVTPFMQGIGSSKVMILGFYTGALVP